MKNIHSLALASLFGVALVTSSQAQFADTLIAYTPGSGVSATFTNHPDAALGAPAETNPYFEDTDPFNPPYGTNQIVSVGAGGALTLKFNAPIGNSPANLFNLDFIIFGNAGFIITNDFDFNTFEWVGTPATDGSLFGDNFGGLTRVSVSHDGTNFFVLNTNVAPTVDNLFPPDGLGNPQIPVNPALTADSFAGATLAQIRTLYNGAGGGRGYDISWAQDTNGNAVVLASISYVRIEVVSGKVEIDAIASVPPQIATQPLSQTVTNAGADITFRVVANSTLPLTYQWFLNGQAIPGATGAELMFLNALTTANAGNYSVVVTSAAGAVASAVATLTKPVPVALYHGLFYETNRVLHGSSGYFTFAIAKTRTFKGKILIEGGSYALEGNFNSNHLAQTTVARPGKSSLTVQLQLLTALAADQVGGSVSDGTWTAPLAGDRAVFSETNVAPQLGTYTLTFFSDRNGDTAPGCGSYGLVTVKTNGAVKLSGAMADASHIAQSSYVAKSGQWPLYVPLYKGVGSLLGWVTFTNQPTLKLTGDVSWIKTNAAGTYYANGFTNTVTVFGGSRR